MKRDLELIRDILLWATSQEHAGIDGNPSFPGYTDEHVAYQVYLMNQAGLVEAEDRTDNDSLSPESVLLNVTWAGHDFIDATRNDTVWRKTKTKVLSSGASFTFDILKDVLSVAARTTLGLM